MIVEYRLPTIDEIHHEIVSCWNRTLEGHHLVKALTPELEHTKHNDLLVYFNQSVNVVLIGLWQSTRPANINKCRRGWLNWQCSPFKIINEAQLTDTCRMAIATRYAVDKSCWICRTCCAARNTEHTRCSLQV